MHVVWWDGLSIHSCVRTNTTLKGAMPNTATSTEPSKMTVIRFSGDGHTEREKIAAELPGSCAIVWVTSKLGNVPDGCHGLDPVEALDEGFFDELDDTTTADFTAVVIDDDGLDPFDVADRMHIVCQARKAAYAIRLLQR